VNLADSNLEHEPTLAEIGAKAVFYLENEPEWVTRHVETVVIESEHVGRRNLTVDVTLPRDERACLGEADGGGLYYIPISMMSKTRLTSEIDLVDEEGRVLPLLTRAENAEISWTALGEIFGSHNWVFQGIDDDLQMLLLESGAEDEGVNAQVAAQVLIANIQAEDPSAERVSQVIADMAKNSLLWVRLVGRPGGRRVVKFSYPIAIRHPVVVQRHAPVTAYLNDARLGDIPVPFSVKDGTHLQKTAAAIVERTVSALGWVPYRTRIEFPQLRSSHSYHLQVIAPAGVDVAFIECLGDAQEYVVDRTSDNRRAHLYISGAPTALAGEISCSYRPERRGFLNWAMLASLVAAAGLWFAQAHVPGKDDTQRQIAAAVLLILPTLLVVLVVRQPEHPVATRLLAGVRTLVMLSGLASVTAAAALAGIRPAPWQTVSEDWIWCAAAATIACAGVFIAWLASFGLGVMTDVARERNGEHYFARTLLAAFAAGVALHCVNLDLAGIDESEPTAAFLLACLSALVVAVAVMNTDVRVRLLRICNVTFATVLLAGSASVLLVESDVRGSVLAWLQVVVLLTGGFAVVAKLLLGQENR
jgi:hypothetical protein